MAPPTGCEINSNPELILDDAGECCPKNLCDFVHTADQTPCAAALVEVTDAVPGEEEGDTSKPPTDAVPGEEEGDTSKPPTDAAPEEESDPSKPPTDILADESSGEDSTDKPPTSDEVHVTEIPSSIPCAEQVCIMVVLECADGETRKVAEGDCCESCVVDAPATTTEFDCRTKEVWSEEKAAWCCANRNLGCRPTSGEAEIPSSNPCAEQACIMVVLECADGETRKVAEGDCCESCVVDAPAKTAEFDCRTKEVWSEEKVMWCCENHNLGCHVISDVLVPGKEIEESEAVEESARAEIHTGVYLTIALGGVMLACIAGYAMHVKNSDGHSRLRAVKEALVINHAPFAKDASIHPFDMHDRDGDGEGTFDRPPRPQSSKKDLLNIFFFFFQYNTDNQ